LLGAPALPSPAEACPFCTPQQTLAQDVARARVVVHGTFKNGQLDGNTGKGTTELHVQTVLKNHEVLGNRQVVVLPRYVPTDRDSSPQFLIFCDVLKGQLDPYRSVRDRDGSLLRYLTGLLAVGEKDTAARLRYTFAYLDHADVDVANDAYKEWGNAAYDQAYRDVARSLSADQLAGWLEDPSTPVFRFGMYASLLGHCGGDKHAALLRKLLDDEKRLTTGVDGALAGYIMLRPREGWDYLLGIARNPRGGFMRRYAALRVIRFYWTYRPDILPKADLRKGLDAFLDQADIADLAIEDLRKWQCWDATERVLALAGKPSHDVPMIRRQILLFALSCQDRQPRAADYVKQQRQKDPERVEEAVESLKP